MIRALFVSVIFVCLGFPLVADESPRERFLREYPQAELALRERYKTLRIVSETVCRHPPELGPAAKGYNVLYMANDGYCRIESERLGNKPSKTVFVDGPENFFMLEKPSGAKEYKIWATGRPSLGKPTRKRLDWFTDYAPIAFAPFGMGWTSALIADSMKERDFSIKEVTVDNRSGYYTVNWEWGVQPPRSKGQWVFDPSRAWVLVAYRRRDQPAGEDWRKFETFGETEYEGTLEGIPLIKVRRDFAVHVDTKEEGSTYITTVKEIGLSNASPDQFTLAAFGLAYERGVPNQRTGLWLLMIGASGIGLSVLLKWWSGKRSTHVA